MPQIDPQQAQIFAQGLNNNLGMNSLQQFFGAAPAQPMQPSQQDEMQRKARLLALQQMAQQQAPNYK
jgi:hypothetical protein